MKFETFFDQEFRPLEGKMVDNENASTIVFDDKEFEKQKARVKRGKRLHIPIEAQIRGIKKALANPKTPSQLKDGMRKRLKKLEGES